MLSRIPKAYRMSNGYKVVPTIQANAVKYLSRSGMKASIAMLVIGLAINAFNIITDFLIGKAVVAGLKFYFISEKKTANKICFLGTKHND